MRKFFVYLSVFCLIFLPACGEKKENQTAQPTQVVKAAKNPSKKITAQDNLLVGYAASGDLPNFSKLLKGGKANLNSADKNGFTPLIAATKYNKKNIVTYILSKKEAKQVLDIGDSSGKTALYYAVENKNPELTLLLKENGANPNAAADDGSLPLHAAIYASDKATLAALLKKSASSIPVNLNAANSRSETALILATQRRNLEFLDQLTALGADINLADNQGYNPLMYAVYAGDKELIAYLLSKKANINFVNKFGFSPLALSIQQGNNDMVMHLIIKGADVNASLPNKPTPLQILVNRENADPVMAKILISKGAKLSAPDMPEGGVLPVAISKGNAEVIKLLISSGANLQQKNSTGLTAAQLIQKSNLSETEKADLLLKIRQFGG